MIRVSILRLINHAHAHRHKCFQSFEVGIHILFVADWVASVVVEKDFVKVFILVVRQLLGDLLCDSFDRNGDREVVVVDHLWLKEPKGFVVTIKKAVAPIFCAFYAIRHCDSANIIFRHFSLQWQGKL